MITDLVTGIMNHLSLKKDGAMASMSVSILRGRKRTKLFFFLAGEFDA